MRVLTSEGSRQHARTENGHRRCQFSSTSSVLSVRSCCPNFADSGRITAAHTWLHYGTELLAAAGQRDHDELRRPASSATVA
jgi:hypothetical protein